MKNKGRKIILSCLFLICLLISATNAIAVPRILNIQIQPETPKPQDEVTFTVDVEYPDYAKGVYLVVDEYSNDDPHMDGFNESMDKIDDDSYEKTINLMHLDTTKIHYHFVINVQNYPDVEWTLSDKMELELDTSMTREYDEETDDDTTTTDEESSDGTTNNTPGFELVFLIIALGLFLYIKKKNKYFN